MLNFEKKIAKYISFVSIVIFEIELMHRNKPILLIYLRILEMMLADEIQLTENTNVLNLSEMRFTSVFSKLILRIDTLNNSCEIGLRSVTQNPIDD